MVSASSDNMNRTWGFGIAASACSVCLFCITSYRSDTLEHKLDTGFANVNARLDDMNAQLETGTANVNTLTAKVNAQFANVNANIEEILRRLPETRNQNE